MKHNPSPKNIMYFINDNLKCPIIPFLLEKKIERLRLAF